MQTRNHASVKLFAAAATTFLIAGLCLHAIAKSSTRPIPEAHVGVEADALAILPASTLQTAIGLEGYELRLRKIGLAPGGKIAKHSHATRPGLVWMLEGSWTEGRPESESLIAANSDNSTIVEDENTVHWFYNDSDELSSAIVCDIVPTI